MGATAELSLRVSVASLVRMVFDHPRDGRAMLVLERTATLREDAGLPTVTVVAKPFGGAVVLSDPEALRARIGTFQFDSERSRRESDFRIQVRPSSWGSLKQVCREQLKPSGDRIFDSSPGRELVEEFDDALGLALTPDQYDISSRGLLAEDVPADTHNVRAVGRPTVRVYYVFEARITSQETIRRILDDTAQRSDSDLRRLALHDARSGGKGRANGVLAAGLDDVLKVLSSIDPAARRAPFLFEGHMLDGNVVAILGDVERPGPP